MIREVDCEHVGPEAFLAASDEVAHLCDRQVLVRLERSKRRLPPGQRFATVDEFNDIYDDDYDTGHWDGSHDQFTSSAGTLIARRSSLDDTAVLMPALPEAWPSFIRHSDTVVSVGRLFLIPDRTGEGWELAGRFDDPVEGKAEAEQMVAKRDVR